MTDKNIQVSTSLVKRVYKSIKRTKKPSLRWINPGLQASVLEASFRPLFVVSAFLGISAFMVSRVKGKLSNKTQRDA